MILSDWCIYCMAALMAACKYKVMVKVEAGKMIYCISFTETNKGKLVGGCYDGKKYKFMGN